MKNLTIAKLKRGACIAGCVLGVAASTGSITGTMYLGESSKNSTKKAIDSYRAVQYANNDMAYQNGEIDDTTYIVKNEQIAATDDNTIICQIREDGTEEQQALLKQAGKYTAWAIAPGCCILPLVIGTYALALYTVKNDWDSEYYRAQYYDEQE